eukprot:TRINITY_DN2264_c0_g1_i2.p1 TRINITY_DN2264_c0_g1~~TRINITY_DN2264_c0_g1_i2.p1  ORF type:complete len:665 (-),score=105.74 TRINITY_DN2264_c0_g1_i2:207-2156(-)
MQDNTTQKTTPHTSPYFSRWSFTRQNKNTTAQKDDNFLEGLDEILNVPEPVLGAPYGVPQLPDDSLSPNQLIYNLKTCDLGIQQNLQEQQFQKSQFLFLSKSNNSNESQIDREVGIQQNLQEQQLQESQLLFLSKYNDSNQNQFDKGVVSNQKEQLQQSQFLLLNVENSNDFQFEKETETRFQIQDSNQFNFEISQTKNINQFHQNDSSYTEQVEKDDDGCNLKYGFVQANITGQKQQSVHLQNSDDQLNSLTDVQEDFNFQKNLNQIPQKGLLINDLQDAKQQQQVQQNDQQQSNAQKSTRIRFFPFWHKTSNLDFRQNSTQTNQSIENLNQNSDKLSNVNQEKGSEKGSSTHSNSSWEFGLPVSVQIPSIISWRSSKNNSNNNIILNQSQNEGENTSNNQSQNESNNFETNQLQNEGDNTFKSQFQNESNNCDINQSQNEGVVESSQVQKCIESDDDKQQQDSKWFRRDRVILVGASATGAVVGGIVAGPLGVAVGYKSGAALVLVGSAVSTFAYHIYHSKHDGTPILCIPSFFQHHKPPPPPPPPPTPKLVKLKYKVKGDSVVVQLFVIHRNQRNLKQKIQAQKQKEKEFETQREHVNDNSNEGVGKQTVQRWPIWRPTSILKDGKKYSVLQQACIPMEVELVGMK